MIGPMDRFMQLLRKLFQFECADLDFGFPRILNYKRRQVESFITDRLPQIVNQAFADYAAKDLATAEQELEQLKEKIEESGRGLGQEPFDDRGNLKEAFRGGELGKQYLDLQSKLQRIQISEELKASVYNDLYTFFSRYYEDGDIFPKPRRGRVEVPYAGHEDVVLHWANKDQHYVKTGEFFKIYRFKAAEYAVTFQLRKADVEQNNNKSAKRYFVLANEKPVTWDTKTKSLTIFFEYRPLTDKEENIYGKTEQQKPQDRLNEHAEHVVLKEVNNANAKEQLSKSRNGQSLLLYHFTRFTRRNTSDFFIHKDVRGFLLHELDFFVKNEVLLLGELVSSTKDDFWDRLHRGRVVRQLGEAIIDFLAQADDFRKKLFEKKKIVVTTDYCLTLDQVPDDLQNDVLKNKAQIAEWRELFGLNEAASSAKKNLDKAFLAQHPSLVVDTRHFPEDFKWRLLSSFDDLDSAVDGILIKSENFQALSLLTEKYQNQVKCIYIDPPYNTGNDGFPYRDNYQHSCWLSMMVDRLALARNLLSQDGTIFVSIDDNELNNLIKLLDDLFYPGNRLDRGVLIWANKGSTKGFNKIVKNHEYILGYGKNQEKVRSLYGENFRDKLGEVEHYCHMAPNPGNPTCEITFKAGCRIIGVKDQIFRDTVGDEVKLEIVSGKMEFKDGVLAEDVVLRGSFPYRDQIEEFFRNKPRGIPTFDYKGQEWLEIFFNKKGLPRYRKTRKTLIISSLIEEKDIPNYGIDDIKDLFGSAVYSFPKPKELVMHLLKYFTTKADVVLDFFAGSGTTGHACINLNREDGGRRRYILVEMGDEFETVLLPRIKKVAFCNAWKDGKPVGGEGSSHIIKYQTLEQYEDTLNNLELPHEAEGQMALEMFGDEYLLHYMLEFETHSSACLLNLDMMKKPFAYQLKVQEGDEILKRTVDLVETFNYLLGIHVKKMRVFENDGQLYRAVLGEKDNKLVVVIWRSLEMLEGRKTALQQDKRFVESQILPGLLGQGINADRLLINGDCLIESAEAIEPEFKRLMFSWSA